MKSRRRAHAPRGVAVPSPARQARSRRRARRSCDPVHPIAARPSASHCTPGSRRSAQRAPSLWTHGTASLSAGRAGLEEGWVERRVDGDGVDAARQGRVRYTVERPPLEERERKAVHVAIVRKCDMELPDLTLAIAIAERDGLNASG